MGEPMQTDIDEGLYSRQLYVLGHDAMRRMQVGFSPCPLAECLSVSILARAFVSARSPRPTKFGRSGLRQSEAFATVSSGLGC